MRRIMPGGAELSLRVAGIPFIKGIHQPQRCVRNALLLCVYVVDFIHFFIKPIKSCKLVCNMSLHLFPPHFIRKRIIRIVIPDLIKVNSSVRKFFPVGAGVSFVIFDCVYLQNRVYYFISSAFEGAAGTYATEICEPRQVRKEAAVSEALCVPYSSRRYLRRPTFFIWRTAKRWHIWRCTESGVL